MKLTQTLITLTTLCAAAAFANGAKAPKSGLMFKCEAEPIYTNQSLEGPRLSFSSSWKQTEQEARDEAVYECTTGGVGLFGCDEGVSCRARNF